MRSEVGGRRSELLLVIAAAALLAGCSPTSKCGPTSGEVVAVVDGDTVDLGSGERIRLLSVDTPETTGGKNDCYGQQAKQFTSDLLLNKQVTLTYDEAECTDRYGRTLAWVKAGGAEANLALVEGGYACSYTPFTAGSARAKEFDDAEAIAKTNRTGMWGACTTVTCG